HRVLPHRGARGHGVGGQHGRDRVARADGPRRRPRHPAGVGVRLPPGLAPPRGLVFDFDPGPRTSIVECCTVALGVREVLAAVSLEGWCKTSGSKGLQMYVPLNTEGPTHEAAADFALAVGQVMERQMPGKVTTVMAKAVRPGKVFVDWSQNAHHKTTIAPYSLRARPEPTV